MQETTITISIAEYNRLKDIETRFTCIREHYNRAEFIPESTQIILGIEPKKKEINADLFPKKQQED